MQLVFLLFFMSLPLMISLYPIPADATTQSNLTKSTAYLQKIPDLDQKNRSMLERRKVEKQSYLSSMEASSRSHFREVSPDFITSPMSKTSYKDKGKGEYFKLNNFTTLKDRNKVPRKLYTFINQTDQGCVNGSSYSKTAPISDLNIYIASSDPRKRTVEVKNDGDRKRIRVLMGKEVLFVASFNVKHLMKHSHYFGFATSKENLPQLNDFLHWELVEEITRKQDTVTGRPTKLVVLACILSPVLFVACIVGACYYFFVQKSFRRTFRRLIGSPREFTYGDLKRATNNFDQKQSLGGGGLGAFYKGQLHKENKEVAIKRISSTGTIKRPKGFLAELSIIYHLRHKHLVKLYGWCYEKGTLLFVYKYMPNGSLDKHLFGNPDAILSWGARFKIIVGLASALRHLHKEHKQKVVHGCLKSSNIMLDDELNVHLGDFGLLVSLDNEKARYGDLEGVSSTSGYIAPECILTGKATEATDIYRLGAVLLEITCGRRPWVKQRGFSCLVNWVWSLHPQGKILEAIDTRLEGNFVTEEIERILLLGLACSHPIAKDRPKSHQILQMILGHLSTPIIPPYKPEVFVPQLELKESKQ